MHYRMILSDDLDLVVRNFLNQDETEAAREFLKEVEYLCLLKGVTGFQQLKAVCPELNIHISLYAGESMEEVVREKMLLTPAWVYEVSTQLLRAQLELLSRNIVHNNIRQSTICIAQDGFFPPVATFIDFRSCTGLNEVLPVIPELEEQSQEFGVLEI